MPAQRKSHSNIPIFVPHQGCPHTCVFCNQKRISGVDAAVAPQQVSGIIDAYLDTLKAEEIEVAFFGGSFTGIPESEMVAFLKEVQPYLANGRIRGIRVSTRPDYINQATLEILKNYGVTVIELGVQSLDAEVLENSKRGHTIGDVYNASALIQSNGFTLGIQTMLGLPGDTFEKSRQTALDVISLAPSMIRIYPAVVLRNTELEELYLNKAYLPLTVDEAVTWCAELVPLYRQADIAVIRTGLHNTDVLQESIVAGPFHPAFGELVEARIQYDKIVAFILDKGLQHARDIRIHCAKGQLSKTIGQRRCNIEALKAAFGFLNVEVIESAALDGDIMVEAIN